MSSNKKGNPYLSIVITSRNDEHGGNMLQRMQVSLSGLLAQLEKHKIESELILVDWNPPADRPLLKDVVKWPDGLRYCTTRAIIVPPSIHQRYEHSDRIPMYAVVATNCGIRRARGQFILPGVIDLLYPDELMSYIASRNLKSDVRYRVDRCDVDRNVVQYDTLKEQLDYGQKNIIRINSHLHVGAKNGLPDLHTNACGDFQLMSRHYWHLLRGYREADIIAAHVDSLLSYASYAAGVKEVILNDPMRIYHIDHDDKFSDRIKTRKPRFEELLLSLPFIPSPISKRIILLYRKLVNTRTRAEVYGIPTIDWSEGLGIVRDILAGKRSYIFNDNAWGLGKEKLPETIIALAKWES